MMKKAQVHQMRIRPQKPSTESLARRVRKLLHNPRVVPTGSWSRPGSIAAVALVLLGATTQVAMDWVTRLPDDAAFRIGDVTTSRQELDHRVHLLSALYGIQPPQDPLKTDQYTRDTAKAVAVSDVLHNAASAQKIVIPDKVASDKLDQIAGGDPRGKQDFITKLGQLGVSENDVRTEIKRQMENAKLYGSVTRGIKPVSDQELRSIFEQRKAQMVTPEQRHLRNIVVPDQNTARDLAQRARSGEDFGNLAAQASQDQSTKDKGGDLGTVAAQQLDKPYADAAFAAPPNTVFGPVQTQNGWNVGQVVDVVPGQPLTFDQVRDQLREQVNNERKSPVWNAWLANTIRSAHVEYAAQYKPANPDAPPNTQ